MIEARPFPSTTFDPESTLREAHRRVAAFDELVQHVPYEAKGVLNSEMLFLISAVGEHVPARIVESGRARGQSTHILALAFPGAEIVSVERDPSSPDASVAAARCGELPNVSLLFGDSNVELPERVETGDIVVIDGPKGWHALRLALDLLESRRPAAVFVHDCYAGQDERRFLERHVAGAFFSDEPAFEAAFSHLDTGAFETAKREGFESWQPHRFDDADQISYGPTYACLPWVEDANYPRARRRLAVARALSRLHRSWRKRIGVRSRS